MLLLDIVFLEMSQKRLEQFAVSKDIGLVVVMTMDIAFLVDSQVLLETMGLSGFYIAA